MPDRCVSRTVSFTGGCAHLQIPCLAHAQSLQICHETLIPHADRRSGRKREHGIKSAGTAVHLHKPLAQTGEPHHSAAPAQRTDKDVFAPHSNTVDHKACAPGKLLQYKNMQESVSSRGRCADAIKTSSPRVRTVCHRMDIASHWTRHDIESLRMRVSAHRQLTSYFSRADFANDW